VGQVLLDKKNYLSFLFVSWHEVLVDTEIGVVAAAWMSIVLESSIRCSWVSLSALTFLYIVSEGNRPFC
jgi:hypothetical protein